MSPDTVCDTRKYEFKDETDIQRVSATPETPAGRFQIVTPLR